MMKRYILACLTAISCAATGAGAFEDNEINWRPPGPPSPGPARWTYIGDFATGSPWTWDHDTVSVQRWGRAWGIAFELGGGNDVLIRNVEITCRGGWVCFQSNYTDTVGRGRPIQYNFRRPLDVQSIRITSKPDGISIPSSRVNVYLLY